MCGVAGFWASRGCGEDEARRLAVRMAECVAHRGPDASGVWVDSAAGVAFAHQRLSIVDLSPAGAQPMTSADGRWVVTYNGEVYNHAALAQELGPSVRFRGRSDTEVLVEGIARWGVKETVQKCIGMFAFAAWDSHRRRLYLVRDRLGIKPLYWGRFGNVIAFGSELSVLKAHPAFDWEIDRAALASYFRYCTVPAPLSIYRSVRKLEPATILTFAEGGEPPSVERFWSASELAIAGRERPFQGSYEDALGELERLLRDAVRLRMVADVPLGAFLSGGIDSPLVVALMQAQSTRPVRTFTIGFREASFDESAAARSLAQALGTDHTELLVSPEDAQAVIPDLPRIYDEPFADSSMIPTLLVSRLARRSVTVALSGDGGDELFGGYNRHLWAPKVWRATRRSPQFLRKGLASAIRSVSPATWDVGANLALRRVPARWRFRHMGEKLHKVAGMVVHSRPRDAYAALATAGDPNLVQVDTATPDPWRSAATPEGLTFSEEMMLLDLVTYLPDDILTKVDRASMAVALEARVPLIDHRVVAFAWSLPVGYRIRKGVTKAPLRDLLARFVPARLLEHPKSGFGVPIGDWVRGPLRGWAEDLIEPKRLRNEGFLTEERVGRLWLDHVEGRTNSTPALWAVLMFQAWLAGEQRGAFA